MNVTAQQREAFSLACERAALSLRGQNGIGSLGEKTLHLAMKYFYEPEEMRHERKVQGYVADIFSERGVVEIQTARLDRLAPKIGAFLPVSDVLVVCPIAVEKWVIWVEPVSGAIGERRKSPAIARPLETVAELYALKPYLGVPGLSVDIVCLGVEEYRLLDGYGENKKKRATKYEKIPVALREILRLETARDYVRLLPDFLTDPFTSRELSAAARIRVGDAQKALNVLHGVGAVVRVGKRGNTYLYMRR